MAYFEEIHRVRRWAEIEADALERLPGGVDSTPKITYEYIQLINEIEEQ